MPPGERGGDTRHDALAQKDHDSHYDRPEHHLLVIMRRGQRLRQHDKDGGTDQGSAK